MVLPGNIGAMALLAANASVVFFSRSWGQGMWSSLGEMFPNQVRWPGLAVAGFFKWFANFLITRTFPMMLGSAAIGLTRPYGAYAVLAFISIFFVVWAVRETKGKELEDMQS